MNLPPTVCRVITWLPVGGIERRLVAILPKLRDLGWQVRLVCIKKEGELASALRDSGIPVDLLRFASRLSPVGLLKLARYFQQHRVSIIHSHMYRSNVPSTIAGSLAGVPVKLGQIHNVDSWDDEGQIRMDRFLVRHRTATLTVSRAVQEDAMARLGVSRRRLPVVYNGIDTNQFAPNAELRERLRQELAAEPGEVLALVPARLHPQKNIVETLEAARPMLKAGKFGLLFAGEGKLRDELIQRSAGLPGIRILGARSDMEALYNACDVVVLSSQREGFSNAVIEALASGKPVIASAVGGNQEAVSSRAFGWIHRMNDFEGLRAQLSEALALGVEGLASMAEACRGRGEEFSLQAMVQQTDSLYRSYLAAAERRS